MPTTLLSPTAPCPTEVLAPWPSAQRLTGRLATMPLPPVETLRTTGFLPDDRARRIASWYLGPRTAGGSRVEVAYAALARELAPLAHAITSLPRTGGLGVRVTVLDTPDEPYADAASLCDELRRHASMDLRSAAADVPHPLLADTAVDQLRMVHDVLGHAALGLGFDVQSEYAAWLYCRPLFSPVARPAAFCELVGAVTAHVVTGERPVLHADLPPAGL
jgi:hypothetical protein